MTRPFLPRAAEIARGLGALLVLALLLFALPIGLYAVAGSPIPEHTPTLSQITAALMQRDTDNVLFLGAVRLIGWAAWGLFVLTICAEAAGYLVGRTTPRLPRPVRPLQYIARDLVATVALSFGAAATVTSPSASAHSTAVGTAEHPVPGAPIHSATAEPRPQQHGAKAPAGAHVSSSAATPCGASPAVNMAPGPAIPRSSKPAGTSPNHRDCRLSPIQADSTRASMCTSLAPARPGQPGHHQPAPVRPVPPPHRTVQRPVRPRALPLHRRPANLQPKPAPHRLTLHRHQILTATSTACRSP